MQIMCLIKEWNSKISIIYRAVVKSTLCNVAEKVEYICRANNFCEIFFSVYHLQSIFLMKKSLRSYQMQAFSGIFALEQQHFAQIERN